LRAKFWLIFSSIIITLLAVEIGARLWVAWKWQPELTYLLTHHTNERGRFTSNPDFCYVLRPDFRDPSGRFTHNSQGWRGREFAAEKPPGTFRVVLMGASTVYGIFVGDDETSAAQLEKRLSTLLHDRKVEVINAGVPGWTTAETVRNLRLNVLNWNPDVIVVVDGRNDIFPQLFNNYRDDYSHYRLPNEQFRHSNYWHKNLFRISHSFMLVAARGGGRFGFVYKDENPASAAINFGNGPAQEELVRNATEPQRTNAFRHNLEQVVRLGRSRGALVVLSTMPFLAEDYVHHILETDDQTLHLITEQVGRNNEVTRAVAREMKVPLVDPAATIARAELLHDDCHFSPEGEQLFADAILAAFKPALGSGLVSDYKPGSVTTTPSASR
jgi:lysophospholipase L1-like esterase